MFFENTTKKFKSTKHRQNETKELLENSRHLDLKVVSSEAVDIGEWDDDNPLNKEHWKEEYKRLFNIKD